MRTPYAAPNSRERSSLSATTFWMPSLSQKRFCANGRSSETVSTTVFGSFAASTLNRRALAAHTPVSRLGTMLRIFRFPAKSASETSPRSAFVSRKSGAFSPLFGSSPEVWMGVPFSVIVAMSSSPLAGGC